MQIRQAVTCLCMLLPVLVHPSSCYREVMYDVLLQAARLREILTTLGPAFVKIGQVRHAHRSVRPTGSLAYP